MPSSPTEHGTSDPALGRPSKQTSQETAECPGAVLLCEPSLGALESGPAAWPWDSYSPQEPPAVSKTPFISPTLGFARFSEECSPDNELRAMHALHQSFPVTADAAGEGRHITGATPCETSQQ